MRKSLFVLLLCVILLSGCDESNTNNGNSNTAAANANKNTGIVTPPKPINPGSPAPADFKSCNPYFPLVPGSLAIYTLNYSTGMVATQRVVTDQAEENGKKVFVETTQIVDASGGAEKKENTVRKYVCDGERIQIIYERVENTVQGQGSIFTHKFDNQTTVMIPPNELTRKGTTWSYSFKQSYEIPGQSPTNLPEPIYITCESQGEEDVKVPADQYKAIKVMKKIKDNYVIEYYVKGIGLVKRVAKDGTSLELKEYSGLKVMP